MTTPSSVSPLSWPPGSRWRRPDIYRPLRTNLVLANAIGFAVFWLYPVAPPRMLPGFVDVVAHVGGLGSWHKTLIDSADQFAAMPSMHLAWAAWCALVAWRLAGRGRRRWAAITIGVAYTLGTAFVVMGTANHYLLDVLAGIACTLVSGVIVEATPLPSLLCGAAVQRDERLAGPLASWCRSVRRAGVPGRALRATSGRARSRRSRRGSRPRSRPRRSRVEAGACPRRHLRLPAWDCAPRG